MLLQIPASFARATIATAMMALSAPISAGPALPAQATWRPASGNLHFDRFDRLKGGAVHSPHGEELGTVEDLVIDRCSGDIRFLILDRGSALGLSATSLALPWSRTAAVEMSAPPQPGAKPGPVLIANVTPEQLDRMPQFDAAQSAAIQVREWIDAMQGAFDDFTDWSQQDRADPFAGALETAEQVTIEGEVVRLRRDRSFDAAEHIFAEIRGDEGRRVVALGPTWYTMGRAHPPMRGAEIVVEGWKPASAADEDGGNMDAVARTATIGEVQIEFRDENGSARWASGGGDQQSSGASPEQGTGPSSGPSSGPADSDRLALASQIVGASATASAQDAGEVKRLVIEQSNGVVAFLEVDPDANFLGLAENTQVVPWEVVASVAPGMVRLDASPQMLSAAPDSPDRAEAPAWFAEQANRDRVYTRFELTSGRFGGGGGE